MDLFYTAFTYIPKTFKVYMKHSILICANKKVKIRQNIFIKSNGSVLSVFNASFKYVVAPRTVFFFVSFFFVLKVKPILVEKN